MRLTKQQYYLNIAKAVSMRSTCLRANAGAIMVKDDKIISTGYSGASKGEPNCCDIGICERERLNIQPGERYELCRSIHAEANALINCDQDKKDSTMYLYFERIDGKKEKHNGPCMMCARMIKNAQIKEVIFEENV
jgi:dCMP deaminase